jgi:hypothetical protein
MLYAEVRRGKNTGIRVTPHKYRNGKYRVATKKEEPYVEVDLDEIVSWIKRGYGVRMSSRLDRHPPGLIRPQSIRGWR